MKVPSTLQEAILYFADIDNCIAFFSARRWPDGVTCPTCGSKDVSYLSTRRMWECKAKYSRKQFSIKIGSIFEDSPLVKWLPAVWLITSAKNGISSCEVARSLGVTQKSAWFMLHRIRLAMQNGSLMKLGGNGGGAVEADKTAVMGILERGGRNRKTVCY